MIRRLAWVFWRRILTQIRVESFSAHWTSYVSGRVKFGGFNKLESRVSIHDSEIGRFTYLSSGTNVARAKIGQFCSIGPDCRIGAFGMHPMKWLSCHPAFYSTHRQANVTFSDSDYFEELGSVTIGNDVWMGAGVYVLEGVNIGSGAIIGAGTIVTKDIPPYAVVVGVPGKVIRYRFSESQISALLEASWWDFSKKDLRRIAPVMRESSVDALVEVAQAIRAS